LLIDSVQAELLKADLPHISTEVGDSASFNAVTSSGAEVADVPSIVRRRAEILPNGRDTFTRQFSCLRASELTESESAASVTYESQILPHLDLDRLQLKPKFHSRLYLKALLSVVVICLILVPIAYFLLVQRSFAGWRPALKWLVASVSVRQVGGSEPQREPSGDAENSGVAKPTTDMQSGEEPTDSTTNSGASAAAWQRQDVQPHDVRRDDQSVATAAVSAQSETASLQRSAAGENSNSCNSKEPVERDFVVPSKFNRTVAPYGSKEPAKLDAAAIGLLVKRGQELFKNGDLIGARTAFRRAAETGDANAALAMGSTYDPIEFLALGVQGVDADITETRRWYETAKRLGSAEASRRLDALVDYY
jgi:hypothetical protein